MEFCILVLIYLIYEKTNETQLLFLFIRKKFNSW